MERKFLEGLDLDGKGLKLDKERVDKIMAEHGKSVEKQKKTTSDLEAERDGLKTQIGEITAKLATFDGVDAEALKKEIETLKGDIATKEKDFQEKNAERDFKDVVKEAISGAKSRPVRSRVLKFLHLYNKVGIIIKDWGT